MVLALKEADAGRLKLQAWIIARCIAGLAIAVPARALERPFESIFEAEQVVGAMKLLASAAAARVVELLPEDRHLLTRGSRGRNGRSSFGVSAFIAATRHVTNWLFSSFLIFFETFSIVFLSYSVSGDLRFGLGTDALAERLSFRDDVEPRTFWAAKPQEEFFVGEQGIVPSSKLMALCQASSARAPFS